MIQHIRIGMIQDAFFLAIVLATEFRGQQTFPVVPSPEG